MPGMAAGKCLTKDERILEGDDMKSRLYVSMLAAILLSAPLSFVSAETAAEKAGDILNAAGVKGGLVVVVGCEDAALPLALRANASYLVHALDTDAARVTQARKAIEAKGLYGEVAVDQWDGKTLPYVEDIVNLLVIENPRGVVQHPGPERVPCQLDPLPRGQIPENSLPFSVLHPSQSVTSSGLNSWP